MMTMTTTAHCFLELLILAPLLVRLKDSFISPQPNFLTAKPHGNNPNVQGQSSHYHSSLIPKPARASISSGETRSLAIHNAHRSDREATQQKHRYFCAIFRRSVLRIWYKSKIVVCSPQMLMVLIAKQRGTNARVQNSARAPGEVPN